MDKELPTSVWSEWKIIEKIGEGSFGKVYKAQRTEQGRTFYSAIKIINIPGSPDELNSVREELSGDDSVREYFQNFMEECIQEVSTMECFRGNSHIVSVEDYKVVEYLDEIGWDIYIRMEYLISFTEYCAGKALTQDEVLKLGCDLAQALRYCRQLNIIHRDIKPENIFVSYFGDFKLGDFGIARELERSMSNMSKKGTYSYMAPEMYRGEHYDRRVDIYSLGIVLYKLMNDGRLPFLSREKQLITYRDKENALAKRMSGEALIPPAHADQAFSSIILKACAYRPEERYQTPEELYQAMDDLRHGRIEFNAEDNTAEDNTAKEPTEAKTHIERMKRHSRIFEKIRSGSDEVKRRPALWSVLAAGIALAACIITIFYVKSLVEENLPLRKSNQVVDILEKNDTRTAQVDEFSTAIETISKQAEEIVNELPKCQEVGKKGERLRYYDDDNKLVKALIYPEMSDDGVYEEYYYWDERLFFAYIWTDNKQELYYYDRRGKLIRWIDSDGTLHDKETDSTEYNKRGEKYWKISLEQFDE